MKLKTFNHAFFLLPLFAIATTGCSKYLDQQQRGAMQTVVRADLDLVASAEKQFHAKNGFYTTDFLALGIMPKNVLYKFGFAQASPAKPEFKIPEKEPGVAAPAYDPARKDLDELLKSEGPKGLKIGYSPVNKLEQIDFNAAAAKYCPDCTATDTGFKALAVANLDDDADLDAWTINEKNEIQHVFDDKANQTQQPAK